MNNTGFFNREQCKLSIFSRATLEKGNLLRNWKNALRIAGYPAPFILSVIRVLIFVLTVPLIASVFGQVLYRKLLEGAIPWSEELARYLFVWLVWLGAVVGIQRKAHFGIQLLVERFPRPLRRLAQIIVLAASTLFLGIVICKGFQLAVANWHQLSPAMRIPMTLPYLSVPVSAVLMLYFVLIDYQDKSQESK